MHFFHRLTRLFLSAKYNPKSFVADTSLKEVSTTILENNFLSLKNLQILENYISCSLEIRGKGWIGKSVISQDSELLQYRSCQHVTVHCNDHD